MRVAWDLFTVLVVLSVVGCSAQKTTESRQLWEPEIASTEQPAQEAGRALPPPGDPVVGSKPTMPTPTDVTSPEVRVEDFVTGLEIPWDIAFPTVDRAYITERPGRVRLVENGKLRSEPYAIIGTTARGEGGLMGIALHPDWPNPRWVYLMYTYTADGNTYNRVSRFTDTGRGLTGETAVVTGIAGSTIHNGGIIRFGPDKMLYIGTGDGHVPERAQDLTSYSGKILRVTPEGNRPKDNPFSDSIVYAYGLRNVQGLAWNPANGDLWATMHGPTGEFGIYAREGVFIVPKGANCGWPRSIGVTDVRDVVKPVLYYPEKANPPGGAVFYRGDFFFSSLGDKHLERVVLSDSKSVSRIERWWPDKYGRLRTVAVGKDDALYVSTSNRDGRGTVRSGDDRILRISFQ